MHCNSSYLRHYQPTEKNNNYSKVGVRKEKIDFHTTRLIFMSFHFVRAEDVQLDLFVEHIICLAGLLRAECRSVNIENVSETTKKKVFHLSQGSLCIARLFFHLLQEDPCAEANHLLLGGRRMVKVDFC